MRSMISNVPEESQKEDEKLDINNDIIKQS